MPSSGPNPSAADHYQIIDTAPAGHVYSGGLLCNLSDPGSARMTDYLCGEFSFDGATQSFNWYHWNGADWTTSAIAADFAPSVGMAAVDLTGNGKADLVLGQWLFGREAAEKVDGDVYWFEQPADPFAVPWERHLLARDWDRPHDLLVDDLDGNGRPDVIVRCKDGKIAWFAMPANPRQPWNETVVAEKHPGDGTALCDITGNGGLDIVTGTGFFANLDGQGKSWEFRPFEILQGLDMDLETRVVAGDCLQDGSVTVVITESEILSNARIVLLHSDDRGKTWKKRLLVDRERDLGALHTLQLVDADGSGHLDIFTAEMELYREDEDILRRPTWKVFLNKGNLEFEECTVLDANLGAHAGFGGRISRPDRADFIAKNWMANSGNACDGVNHVIHVTGWPAE